MWAFVSRKKIEVAAAFALMSTSSSVANAREHHDPGLYGLEGWNRVAVDTYLNNSAAGSDVNGDVGHPLDVDGPRAWCYTARDVTEKFLLNGVSVVSGSLPPGVALDYDIRGIPTERGHWIVKIAVASISCGSSRYKGFTQELRFHISGGGMVHE